jgi:hypothetical protein
MNVCHEGGYLVDANHTVSDDLNDWYQGGRPIIGCNRLRCSQCRALVRNVAGVMLRGEPDLKQLYEVEDLYNHPTFEKVKPFREYLCRCTSWTEKQYRAVADPDAGFDAPNVPWRCQGHAPVELPHYFDGVMVRSEGELAALIDSALAGNLPPKARKEDGPATWWLIRLSHRLAQTPYSDTLVQTVAKALESADPKIRGRALRFFFSVESDVGMRRALELYDKNRALYVDVPDEVTDVSKDKTLEDSLWRVIGPMTGRPGRARELARAEAVAPGRGRNSLYSAIAREDAEWVGEHIEEIFKATPALGQELTNIVRARFPENVPSKPVVDKLRALVAKSVGPN